MVALELTSAKQSLQAGPISCDLLFSLLKGEKYNR